MNKREQKAKKTDKISDSLRKQFSRRWYAVSFVFILLWSIWTLLDAFVVPRDIIEAEEFFTESASEGKSYEEVEDPAVLTETDEEEKERMRLLTDPVITDTTYNNGEVSIEIRYMRTLYTDVYVADITLRDPSYLETALAEGAFGRNLTDRTSTIAEQNDAILAINGDYYGFRDTGYVVRNGYLYRSVPGPGLVIDGEVCVEKKEEVKRAQVTNPRTAFGVISPLHFLFVVSDGRTDENVGLSLFELAGLMKDLGCETAYNLDGGGSSTMWFNGRVLNKPTTFGETIAERKISDIVYISK